MNVYLKPSEVYWTTLRCLVLIGWQFLKVCVFSDLHSCTDSVWPLWRVAIAHSHPTHSSRLEVAAAAGTCNWSLVEGSPWPCALCACALTWRERCARRGGRWALRRTAALTAWPPRPPAWPATDLRSYLLCATYMCNEGKAWLARSLVCTARRLHCTQQTRHQGTRQAGRNEHRVANFWSFSTTLDRIFRPRLTRFCWPSVGILMCSGDGTQQFSRTLMHRLFAADLSACAPWPFINTNISDQSPVITVPFILAPWFVINSRPLHSYF